MPCTPELPLEPQPLTAREIAAHPDALRQAYLHSGLRRHGIAFDAALASDPIRICLSIAAEIKAKKLLEQRA